MSRPSTAILLLMTLLSGACRSEANRGSGSTSSNHDPHWFPLLHPIKEYQSSTGDRPLVVLFYKNWDSGGILLRKQLLMDPVLKREAARHRPVFLKADFTNLSGAAWDELQARQRPGCHEILIISKSKGERWIQPDFSQQDWPRATASIAASIANELEP